MKKTILMLFIFMICGVIIADICVNILADRGLPMAQGIYKSYAYSKLSFSDMLWKLLYERGKLFLLIWLMYLTPLQRKMPSILLSIFSFCFGYFGMNCILSLGFVGVLVAVSCVFPHGLLYGGIFVLWNRTRYQRVRYRTRELPGLILQYGFMFLMFLTACVMECLMTVHFIPWIIRLSFI